MIQDFEYADRVKLPFQFDAHRLATEYAAMDLQNYIYYSVIMMALPGEENAPPGSAYFREVMQAFHAHAPVRLARILRLEPGAAVAQHCDPMLGIEVEDADLIRLTVPILGQDNTVFYLNGTPVPMKAGECWYLRLSDQHRIENGPVCERVNLTIDIERNDWSLNMIAEAQNRRGAA